MENNWYKLDNAAKIYPAIRKTDWSPIFRIDAVLVDNIEPELLQSALIMTYRRFPTFSVHMSKGLFWYYFEPNDSLPEVKEEDRYPCRPFLEVEDKGYLFRILYYKKRISLEVFHSITDGYGATIFLKTLVYNYLTISNSCNFNISQKKLNDYGILYYKDLPTAEEVEDSFQFYAQDGESLKLKEKHAFEIQGTRIKKDSVKLLHVILSVKALRKLAKEYGCTITAFLTSLYIYSVGTSRLYNCNNKKPIKVSVPINLRKHFPSKTLRNFSSYINVEIFPKDTIEKFDLKEICASVSKQLKDGTDVDLLRMKFSGTVNAEKKISMRIAPLFLKNLVLNTYYTLFGEQLMTSTISNIGFISFPEEISDLVERFDFVLGAPKQNPMNCAVLSYNDTISISFTSVISENSIINGFVSLLKSHDIEVKIEANY